MKLLMYTEEHVDIFLNIDNICSFRIYKSDSNWVISADLNDDNSYIIYKSDSNNMCHYILNSLVGTIEVSSTLIFSMHLIVSRSINEMYNEE